jgi:hypothetical protein
MMTRRTILQLPLAAAFASPASDTFRMLHIDAHFASVPNPYQDFDAERAAATIADAGFQLVSIFAVCNRGLSYYPTKVGTIHPGLKRDFTGEFSKALKKRGLQVLAYVSVRDCRPNIAQLQEIVDWYAVDGFFFDSVLKCRDEDNTRFIDGLKPGPTYFMNHLWVTTNPVNPPKSLKTLCWEPVPPYRGVMAEDLSIQARYLSTIPRIDNWTCMATRGNGWGDLSVRDRDTYLHEAAIVLAAGGRPYWGDVSYPSGNPEPAVYSIWREVNARTASLEPFVRNVKPVKEIAVRIPSAGMTGAHRALVEEHAQFSLLNPQTLAATLSEYKALILPEAGALTPPEVDAIRKFDGAVFATGEFDPALADILGVKPLGKAEVRRSFLRRQYDIQVSGPYQRVESAQAEVISTLADGNPGITRRGRAVYSAVELFGAYEKDRTPVLRRVISELLETVFSVQDRQLEIKNAPSSVEIMLNRRQNDTFLHLVNRLYGYTRVQGVQIRLRTGRRPKGLREVPSRQPIEFEFRDGQVSFEALPVHVHSAYQIEG